MARFNPHHQIEPVLEAAAQWRDRCLIANGSLLYPDRAVWTPSNIASLNDAFIDHPDTGEDTFLIKLRGQVAHLAPDIVRLTAEMIWVLQLFPSNTGAAKKRDNIENILSWLSDPAVPDRQLLADEVLGGVGSTGTAFNTHRPKEFAYLISMSKTLKSQNEGQRQAVLSDPWAFAEFLKSVPVEGNRQLSHIVEYLLFPDTFERISSGEEKRKIIVAFGDESADAVKQLDREGRDRRLVAIRRKIAADRGDPNFDFYDDEFRKLWQEGEGVEPGIGTTITSEDVRLFQRSRRHSKYAQLMPEEVAAYRRIHSALGRLGQEVVSALSGGGYVYKLTSGYTPQSGVRGALPKDLWFGVHAAENADAFVGHPQLFMIVSERGIEYGFSALTHPADFSNAEVKARVRGAAPNLFRLLPSADSALASSLSSELDRSRGWKFLRKERLSPDDPGFENLGSGPIKLVAKRSLA